MSELNNTWETLRIRLTSYVRNKVEADVAEDIVHDILLRVLKHQNILLEADQPLAWIYTVAKNRITDYYRQQSKINAISTADQEGVLDTASYSENDRADEEFSRCMQPLLAGLDEKYSQALLLTDFGDMNQSDAAKQLGIPGSTMKSRVQRARVKLKKQFLDCCTVEMNRFGNVVDYQYKDDKSDCC